MGLLPTVLICVVFPALMLLITLGLGRMEEFLLPHLRAPLPADGDQDSPAENTRPGKPGTGDDGDSDGTDPRPDETGPARARARTVRSSARRRAYGTPRPVGRTNTGPPRGARTTPLRFR
ncbi:hypothetical protein OG875_29260 [Streptomyces sp. NBC_01498]|uniref:hypothetical protein n=1 Tax=Streptomyces sp. NBC_01498 TaxID=2975870 RepID=UPI002E7C1763|nr:hypothetical protein [Streptomyces sp. NBC_01498]WTL28315.1 hypothetical protein OG875_29260 [Streptomyces sp. NBC_01498]